MGRSAAVLLRLWKRQPVHDSFSGRAFSSNAFAERRAKESKGCITVQIQVPFSLHNLAEGPPVESRTGKKELLAMYMDMLTIRRMEISADMLFKSQQVRGFCHLYDGQEAVAIGLKEAISKEDAVITAYRDHGIFLAKGGTPFEVFSELTGRVTGCAAGKGGSMHLYKRENNFFGGWGIVGTTSPLGAGLALALKYCKKNNVAVAIHGDGADNQGQVYEAKNMAALWDLPLILLIENNHFGMGTAEWRASKKASYFDRVSYLPGIKADGMDVFAVKEALLFCKEHCLAGKGPIVIECDTYRYHGHSMSDPGSTYRTWDEIKQIRQARDPIQFVKQIILKEGAATEEELATIDKQVKKDVEDALSKAREAPEPKEEALFTDMYKHDKKFVVYGCDRKQATSRLA
ncbi:hypothetical protein GOP47_0025421 [Adiantum capillus-veneris]|uniref:Pyruvate dehydrogenase E1 component subunit alpha n=1 Tax=Adiantum capillus-veneris TaxID=13818 RepID=A0A9D4U0Q2_ADICA|nr:hypothetical protein GOP47_0025421 [Adiantum capillus-veneris]